jgi:two-component system chemotaxis response regulator CheY
MSPSSTEPVTRILLVDDSTAAREQVRLALTAAMRIHITEASDGEEGLWRARTGQHDLVITDMHMPSMNGLTFVRRLRELPEYESVPVLLLTSDPTRERLEEGREVGATSWLIKPPKPEALVMTVRHLLRR